jgi:hypothetical protein
MRSCSASNISRRSGEAQIPTPHQSDGDSSLLTLAVAILLPRRSSRRHGRSPCLASSPCRQRCTQPDIPGLKLTPRDRGRKKGPQNSLHRRVCLFLGNSVTQHNVGCNADPDPIESPARSLPPPRGSGLAHRAKPLGLTGLCTDSRLPERLRSPVARPNRVVVTPRMRAYLIIFPYRISPGIPYKVVPGDL